MGDRFGHSPSVAANSYQLSAVRGEHMGGKKLVKEGEGNGEGMSGQVNGASKWWKEGKGEGEGSVEGGMGVESGGGKGRKREQWKKRRG